MLNKIKAYITLAITALLFTPVAATNENEVISGSSYLNGVLQTNTNQGETLNKVSDTLKTFLGFVRGAGIIVCVIMLAWCAIQLAMSSGNQQKRQVAMDGIKNVLIAVAIIGSATLISSLAYGLLG